MPIQTVAAAAKATKAMALERSGEGAGRCIGASCDGSQWRWRPLVPIGQRKS
jgi:hypothetical protein